VYVYVQDHPAANADHYVFEHRVVMEQVIGRYLTADEVVHHINHMRDDNRPENLMLISRSDHSVLHAPERIYPPETRKRMSDNGKRGAAARWSKKT
jgi:hypothetical protein